MIVYFNQTKTAKLKEIVFLEAIINSTIIHLKSGDVIKVGKTLKKFEGDFLPGNFFRVNRKCIVNLDLVKTKKKRNGQIFVKIMGNPEIPISRRRIVIFENFLKNMNRS
ncbi:MAG: LytTR family transcriptional regulator [Leadbetterella sp.]|jgi:DNA-binding LytR/AlgR family response regulator|nr:LytTR family transcriptional regulator [Leadbetterella sp.]